MTRMNIVVLTGAGLSAESGIPTFRASDGLWNNHRVEEVATPQGWKANRELVLRFYNERRDYLCNVEPNDGHFALARLERAWVINDFIHITQNIDPLAELAGGTRVLHMHGELCRMRCSLVSCAQVAPIQPGEWITSIDKCPKCKSQMRPDVVWFGEMPYHLDPIEKALDACDIFISVGTSGQVMPASLFAEAVSQANPNAEIIEVNPNPSGLMAFNRVIQQPASVALPTLVDELLARL